MEVRFIRESCKFYSTTVIGDAEREAIICIGKGVATIWKAIKSLVAIDRTVRFAQPEFSPQH